MSLKLNSSSGGSVTLQEPVTASNLTFTLPSADGTNGQVIQTNGSGVLSFVTVSGGGGSVTISDVVAFSVALGG